MTSFKVPKKTLTILRGNCLKLLNTNGSKDKDTNFVQAILPSDWTLMEAQAVKPVKRESMRGIGYIHKKTLKPCKVKDTLKSRRKTLIVFETKRAEDIDSLHKATTLATQVNSYILALLYLHLF